MAIILNIETSTKNCSVSIANKGQILAIKELNDGGYSHAEQLHQFIEILLKESKLNYKDLDAIAVSKGPGSYTGLRIGVSAAKGLSFALDIPLISIETLESLSYAIAIDDGFIIPMIDARRMEVYAQVFDNSNKSVRVIKAEIIDENSYMEYLSTAKVYFLGDGAHKCKEVIKHDNAVFVDDKFPSSLQMAVLSYEKHKKNDIEDVAYFEPFYLKDFVATPQKKKV